MDKNMSIPLEMIGKKLQFVKQTKQDRVNSNQ